MSEGEATCLPFSSSRNDLAPGHEHTHHLGGTVWRRGSAQGLSSTCLASESLRNMKDVPCSHLLLSMPHRPLEGFFLLSVAMPLGAGVRVHLREPCVNVGTSARACMPYYGQICVQGCLPPPPPRQPYTGSQPAHLESPWPSLLMI